VAANSSAEYNHQYYLDNKERLLAEDRRQYAENKEEQQARSLTYQRANKADVKARRKKTPYSRIRRANLRKLGMDESDYELLLKAQGGLCALCGEPPLPEEKLHVDHCHQTMRIRGLLHGTCNVGLGMFKDRPDLLRKAAAYLEKP
jgi:hypothetical protein